MNHFMAIRTEVFGLDQQGFAALLGISQGTISRWEKPVQNALKLFPNYHHLEKIRKAAKKKKLPWQDAWLFGEGLKRTASNDEAPKGRKRIHHRSLVQHRQR